MRSYTCIDGEELPLAALDETELFYLETVVARYRAGASADELYRWAIAGTNPVLVRHGMWVTREVMDHPLYRALADLEDRAGVREGADLEPGDDPTSDPLGAATATTRMA